MFTLSDIPLVSSKCRLNIYTIIQTCSKYDIEKIGQFGNDSFLLIVITIKILFSSYIGKNEKHRTQNKQKINIDSISIIY